MDGFDGACLNPVRVSDALGRQNLPPGRIHPHARQRKYAVASETLGPRWTNITQQLTRRSVASSLFGGIGKVLVFAAALARTTPVLRGYTVGWTWLTYCLLIVWDFPAVLVETVLAEARRTCPTSRTANTSGLVVVRLFAWFAGFADTSHTVQVALSTVLQQVSAANALAAWAHTMACSAFALDPSLVRARNLGCAAVIHLCL